MTLEGDAKKCMILKRWLQMVADDRRLTCTSVCLYVWYRRRRVANGERRDSQSWRRFVLNDYGDSPGWRSRRSTDIPLSSSKNMARSRYWTRAASRRGKWDNNRRTQSLVVDGCVAVGMVVWCGGGRAVTVATTVGVVFHPLATVDDEARVRESDGERKSAREVVASR